MLQFTVAVLQKFLAVSWIILIKSGQKSWTVAPNSLRGACRISFSQQATFWIISVMIIRDKEKLLGFPVLFHSTCSFMCNFLLIWSICCKRRLSPLQDTVPSSFMILDPTWKESKVTPYLSLFSNYNLSWRKKMPPQKACKKPSHQISFVH